MNNCFFKNVFTLDYPKSSDRIDIYDFLRGLAMLLVILHHAGMPGSTLVLVFHMPLFFFLSGWVSGNKGLPSFGEYIIARFKRLMIPYLFFGFLLIISAWVYSLIIHESFDLLFGLLGVILGKYGFVPEENSGIYWFLMAIFVADLLIYPINKYLGNSSLARMGGAFLFVALSYVSTHLLNLSIFMIDVSFMGAAFLLLGSLFKPYNKYIVDNQFRWGEIAVIIIGFVIVFLSRLMNDSDVRMYLNQFGDYGWFFLGAIGGIVSFLLMGKYVYMVFYKTNNVAYKILMTMGYNSLTLFIGHLIINKIFNPIYDSIGVMTYLGPRKYWIVLFVTSISLGIFLCNFINLYMPWSIGMKKKQ